MTAAIDITAEQRKMLLAFLRRFIPGVAVWVYGSRVKWTARPNSDLDLVAFTSPTQRQRVSELKEALDESDLPFLVDLHVWDEVPERFHEIIRNEYVVLQEAKQQETGSGMAGGWHEATIGELAEIFDGPHATPSKTSTGPIFLGISNLAQGRLDVANTEHLSEEDYVRWTRRVEPQIGDVVFSYETRLGEAAFIPPGLRCCLGRRMGLLRARPGKVDKRFLLYAYLGPQFQETLRSRTIHGSTVDRIPLIDMARFPIEMPDSIEEQRAIAHILGTLDDKIELNRRMSETLEAMARALFKSWFVDFDPVRAKAEGRDPGLPKPLADLFPDSFEDSELGEIPKGWRCSYLREVTTKIGSGATPRGGGSVYVADGVALIRSQNVYDSLFVWEGLARITDAAADALQGVTVEHEDILLNITGASILRTCVVDRDVLPARVNQHVCIIRPKPEIPTRYLHFHLLQPLTKGFLMGMDAGASRQAVTKGHIESVPLVIPPKVVLDMFANLAGPLFGATSNNKSQSRSLALMRDTLLPKLISGELRVRQSEETTGAVA